MRRVLTHPRLLVSPAAPKYREGAGVLYRTHVRSGRPAESRPTGWNPVLPFDCQEYQSQYTGYTGTKLTIEG